ncbi:hypothetical protein BX589_103136 [Paraburkholderia fungorum]|jgi:3-oxoadipate enol-lactonase|uniref:hypothetical protein n=1 Tax=Paraburkholderia fungorum TaxID=134537 RepID=UPI000D4FC7C9|nr:hypothetical protein [Paraburkholderia fungorum]PRZ55551.1 hypothetical protein BX589_103136 [Paraburkholderia fungorum]
MACEALRDFRVRGKLVTICRVTLTMVGCHGTGTLPAAMQAIADAFEGAQFECSMRRMLDAARLSPIEQSHRFAALLETFPGKPV